MTVKIDYDSLDQTADDIRAAVAEFRAGKITRDVLDSLINANGKVIKKEQVKIGGLIYEMELDRRTAPHELLPQAKTKKLKAPAPE